MGLCMSYEIEPEPIPRRFRQQEVGPSVICEQCKRNGSEVYFNQVLPYASVPIKEKARRHAIVATRCPRGHEIPAKIECEAPVRKVASKCFVKRA